MNKKYKEIFFAIIVDAIILKNHEEMGFEDESILDLLP